MKETIEELLRVCQGAVVALVGKMTTKEINEIPILQHSSEVYNHILATSTIITVDVNTAIVIDGVTIYRIIKNSTT